MRFRQSLRKSLAAALLALSCTFLAGSASADVDGAKTFVEREHSAIKKLVEANAPSDDVRKAIDGMVEKPMTLDLPSSAALVQEARGRGRFLMEAMWMRCNPAIRQLTDLVAAGGIGDLVSVHADFGLQGPFDPAHRLRAPELGGGALLDLGVYPLNLAHVFLGTPAEVRSWGKLTPEGVDETTGILLGYRSGAVAVLTCSINGPSRNAATIPS